MIGPRWETILKIVCTGIAGGGTWLLNEKSTMTVLVHNLVGYSVGAASAILILFMKAPTKAEPPAKPPA